MKGWGGKTGTEEDRGDLDDIISKELKDPANHGISFSLNKSFFLQGLDEELAYAVGKDFGDDYLRWKQDHQYASTKKQVRQSNEDFIDPELMLDLIFRFANG